jgi:hypothetical protein
VNRTQTHAQHGHLVSRVAGVCPVATPAPAYLPTGLSPRLLNATSPMNAKQARQGSFDGIWNLSTKREHQAAIT